MRIFYILALVLSLLRPWWAICLIPLLATFSILDPGKSHRLVQVEVFVLGAILGTLLQWRPQPRFKTPQEDLSPPSPPPPTFQRSNTLWTCVAFAVVFGVIASSIPGIQMVFFSDEHEPRYDWLLEFTTNTLFGYATEPAWALRSVYNWITGLGLVWAISRLVTPARAKTFLLLAGFSAVVSSGLGLLEFTGWVSFDRWRPQNLQVEALGTRRLVGLAGHPGWLAEWLVLTWPGLLLLWSPQKKRRLLLHILLCVVGLALLLTLARAGWLAGGIAGGIAAFYAWRIKAFEKKTVWALGIATLIVGIIGLAVNYQNLTHRFSSLLAFQDRQTTISHPHGFWASAHLELESGYTS